MGSEHDYQHTAAAVLSLGCLQLARAQELVTRYQRVAAVFGEGVAQWCCADNREHLGPDKALAYWEKIGTPTAVMYSAPGSGKTTACAAWGADHGALMMSACEVDTWPWGGGARADEITLAPVLVVDDFGRENAKSQGLEALVNALARRHDAGRKTLVCGMLGPGNASVAGCRGRYAAHWVDRVGPIPDPNTSRRSSWLPIKREQGSMREGETPAQPRLEGLETARRVVNLARRVSLTAQGLRDAPGEIDRLGELLALQPLAIELEASMRRAGHAASVDAGESFLEKLEGMALDFAADHEPAL